MVKKIAEKFNRLSRVHQRHRQQTDRRQTDGIATASSDREREFTFAKNTFNGADVQDVQKALSIEITTANKQTACCPSLDATGCQHQCRQVSAARTRDTSSQRSSVARLLSLLTA